MIKTTIVCAAIVVATATCLFYPATNNAILKDIRSLVIANGGAMLELKSQMEYVNRSRFTNQDGEKMERRIAELERKVNASTRPFAHDDR